MCDALWVIASALGNQIARYEEVMKPERKQTQNHTTQEVVDDILSVIRSNRERRMKNGDTVRTGGEVDSGQVGV